MIALSSSVPTLPRGIFLRAQIVLTQQHMARSRMRSLTPSRRAGGGEARPVLIGEPKEGEASATGIEPLLPTTPVGDVAPAPAPPGGVMRA